MSATPVERVLSDSRHDEPAVVDRQRQHVVGALAGLGATLVVSRFLASMLFHVSATDPSSLGTAMLLLLGVGCIAAYLPARRAARVNPVEALRSD